MVLALLVCQEASSQSSGFGVSAGYGLIKADMGAHNDLDATASFGLNYQFQAGRLLIQTGIERTNFQLRDTLYTYNYAPGVPSRPYPEIAKYRELSLPLKFLYRFPKSPGTWLTGIGAAFHYYPDKDHAFGTSLTLDAGYAWKHFQFIAGSSPIFFYKDEYDGRRGVRGTRASLDKMKYKLFLGAAYFFGRIR